MIAVPPLYEGAVQSTIRLVESVEVVGAAGATGVV
jgi:hypothetical protein